MSSSDDTYRTIEDPVRADTKVMGSRFIAEAFPIVDEVEAESRIELVRRREYSATHHCTAFRFGVDGSIFRSNDDGEPSGTAGQPILRQIDARDLTNTLVVVTRYFGGTKLGTGGLIRAYGDAAATALDSAKIVRHVITVPVHVSFEYEDTSPAMHTIERFHAEVVESRYSDRTDLGVFVRRNDVENFIQAFVEALGGRGRIERGRLTS
ncbi:MAG: YigZ family protein [Rhodothermales bacterium]